ncbi:MAG: light-harvesting protein [Pseudomonadota bacterium]
MNNSRMWLVVSPNVGLPILLGGVAVGSFCVHLAVISNSTWFGDFVAGKELAQAEASVQTASAPATTGEVSLTDGQRIVVVLPDGTRAEAVLQGTPGVAVAEATRPRD